MRVQTKITLLLLVVVTVFIAGLGAFRAFDLQKFRRITEERFNERNEAFDLFLKQDGEPLQIHGTERLARCLAHETDHLDGVLFIDRLDRDQRKLALREIRELVLDGETIRVKPSPHRRLM